MAISYVRFCEEKLRVELRPGQRVVGLVAFDGVDPVDLTGDERELADIIFGEALRFTPQQRRFINLVCGGRGGKTRFFSATRALHIGLTFDLRRLAPGESGYGIFVAPKMELAQLALDYVRGAVLEERPLRENIVTDNTEELVLHRKGGDISFLCAAASVGGAGQRGKSLFFAGLEESAFFRNKQTGAVNDLDLFRAMMPRVMLGGQLVNNSTPDIKSGLLWDTHDANFGHPVDACAAHAPTLLLRDEEHIRLEVEAEYARDPLNASREFGAQFLELDASRFFDGPSIEAATDETIQLGGLATVGDRLTAGADFGFVKNTSALVLGAWRDRVFHVLEVVERIPVSGAPLRPSETVLAFAKVVQGYGVDLIVADGHYREAIRENLHASSVYLKAAPEGQRGKADSYAKLRMLLREGRVRLPSHARLLQQLREVEGRNLSGGGITISSRTWTDGAHGDLVAALVLAVWQDHGREIMPALPAPGSPDALEQRLLATLDRRNRKENRWR